MFSSHFLLRTFPSEPLKNVPADEWDDQAMTQPYLHSFKKKFLSSAQVCALGSGPSPALSDLCLVFSGQVPEHLILQSHPQYTLTDPPRYRAHLQPVSPIALLTHLLLEPGFHLKHPGSSSKGQPAFFSPLNLMIMKHPISSSGRAPLAPAVSW